MAERRQEKACKDTETGLAGGRREEIRANEKVQKKKKAVKVQNERTGGASKRNRQVLEGHKRMIAIPREQKSRGLGGKGSKGETPNVW